MKFSWNQLPFFVQPISRIFRENNAWFLHRVKSIMTSFDLWFILIFLENNETCRSAIFTASKMLIFHFFFVKPICLLNVIFFSPQIRLLLMWADQMTWLTYTVILEAVASESDACLVTLTQVTVRTRCYFALPQVNLVLLCKIQPPSVWWQTRPPRT